MQTSSDMKEKSNVLYIHKTLPLAHMTFKRRPRWQPGRLSYAPTRPHMRKNLNENECEAESLFAHIRLLHMNYAWHGFHKSILPFTFSLGLNSLVQNQLLNAFPGPELTWRSIYEQPRSNRRKQTKEQTQSNSHYCCDTTLIKPSPPRH